jgi:pyruvate dehydrogenase complex dehydrogenase (E1) component
MVKGGVYAACAPMAPFMDELYYVLGALRFGQARSRTETQRFYNGNSQLTLISIKIRSE